jgi:hypothetical protein
LSVEEDLQGPKLSATVIEGFKNLPGVNRGCNNANSEGVLKSFELFPDSVGEIVENRCFRWFAGESPLFSFCDNVSAIAGPNHYLYVRPTIHPAIRYTISDTYANKDERGSTKAKACSEITYVTGGLQKEWK